MNKFLLKGDLSGIQEYIFNVSSKGAAKSLKSRSYLVQVIGELATQFCIKHLGEYASVFYSGGGNFYIDFQSENEDEATKLIENIRQQINEEFIYDELAINLSFVRKEEDKFGEAWFNLQRESNIQRLKSNHQYIEYFEPYQRTEKQIAQNETSIPDEVKQQMKWLGFDLSESNDLYKVVTNRFVKNGKFKYSKLKINKKVENYDGELINKLPIWKDDDKLSKYIKYKEENPDLNDDSVSKPGHLIDFNAFGFFAALRTGTNKLGVLKLDVDNLGKIFGEQAVEKNAQEISARFSRFFNKQLYQLYKDTHDIFGIQENFNTCIYPIFAGGDDCFIVGSWDAILCFALALHNHFKNELSEYNISAGIILIDSSYPVKSFAEDVEDALSKAKQKKGKNAITLFDQVFTWEEYSHILETSEKVVECMNCNQIDRSFLDKLRKSAKGFGALQTSKIINFPKIYKLRYYLGRNDKRLLGLVNLLFEPYYECLNNKIMGKKQNEYQTAAYPVIARIAELLTRKKLEI